MDNRKLIVTSAFPFAPAELGMANFASTYLPADAYRRFLSCLGSDVVHLCATDVHSVYTSRDGVTRDEAICAACNDRYRSQFAALGVECDVYETTDHPQHIANVNAVLHRLLDRGAIYKRPTKVLQCEGCSAFLPRQLALDPESGLTGAQLYDLDLVARHGLCHFCKGRAIVRTTTEHWFLRIDAYRDVVERAVTAQIQDDVRASLESTLRSGPPDWNFSRDNGYGLAIPFDTLGKTVYLWLESLIAYDTLAGMAGVRGNARRYFHFMGKNITYYHGIVWPVLLQEGLAEDGGEFQISARGFMDLGRSDEVLKGVETAVEAYPRDFLRFYVLYSVPDKCVDFALSTGNLAEVCNKILINKGGNLLHRLWSLLRPLGDAERRLDPADPLVKVHFRRTIENLEQLLGRMQVQRAVREVVDYLQLLNQALAGERLHRAETPETRGLLVFMAASAMTLLRPIAPALIEDHGFFTDWKPETIHTISGALKATVSQTPTLWKKV
jgi:methionyl-tRNA synthetase